MRASFVLPFVVVAVMLMPGCGRSPSSTIEQANSLAPDIETVAPYETDAADIETDAADIETVATNDTPVDKSLATAEQTERTWRELFDGETLKNFKITKFGGEGDVTVADGTLQFDFGQYMTGVTYDSEEELPKINYEIQYEAQRLAGFDFFSGVTFPVNDSFCSFIVGGWGGSVVGISSIDDMDASENETTEYITFKNGQWYEFRLRVTAASIECWIDDKRVVNVDIKDRKLSTRIEVDLCTPLGFCCFDTKAAMRNVRIRKLAADELAAYDPSHAGK